VTDVELHQLIDTETAKYSAFLESLLTDLRTATARAKDGDAFDRRNVIRTFFTLVEGDTYYRKQLALMLHEASRETTDGIQPSFTEEEVVLLRDAQAELSSNGTPRTQTKFLRLSANVRFSFDAIARAFGVNCPLDVEGPGWQAFLAALDVRHRLTHPKTVEDLDVSETDLANAITAIKWYFASLALLFDGTSIDGL
jgi:hypothetical protein